jgi:hypothetical protein
MVHPLDTIKVEGSERTGAGNCPEFAYYSLLQCPSQKITFGADTVNVQILILFVPLLFYLSRLCFFILYPTNYNILLFQHQDRDRRGRDRMVVDLQLPMQSVPITTEVMS